MSIQMARIDGTNSEIVKMKRGFAGRRFYLFWQNLNQQALAFFMMNDYNNAVPLALGRDSDMLRVAIVEDSVSDRELLRQYLSQFSQETGENCDVSTYTDGVTLLEKFRPGLYDLILMDIQLPHLDGMSTARELRNLDEVVLILFITNMAQYALKGYEVDALDYMLKPVSYFAFALKMRKVQRVQRERGKEARMLPFDGELRRIPLRSILYVEVTNHQLCFHTYEGDSVMSGSLKTWEEDLSPYHFVRCNNCYLVNLLHVLGVTTDTVKVGGFSLRISRPRRKEFMQALSEYYGGGGR